jgi:hypothetical protein
MPNWVYNKLVVTVKTEHKNELEKFIGFACGKGWSIHATEVAPFDFNKFIPYPERFLVIDRALDEWVKQNPDKDIWSQAPIKDSYNSGGYDWCIANWGTKWNAGFVKDRGIEQFRLTKDRKKVTYKFDTAWAPPLPVILKASEMFPNLKFRLDYDEETGWGGTDIFIGGESKYHDEYEGNEGDEEET